MTCCAPMGDGPFAGGSSSGVGGSGTAPHLSRWTGATTLGDGTLLDDGAGTLSTADAAAPVDVVFQGGSCTAGANAGAGWAFEGGDGGPAGGGGGSFVFLPGGAPSGVVGCLAVLGQLAIGGFGGAAVGTVTASAVGPATVQNWAPSATWRTAAVLRLSVSVGVLTIGGLDATASSGRARLLLLLNVGAQSIVINREDVGSVASNRFQLFKATITLPPGTAAVIWYDQTASRWSAWGLQGVT